MRSIILRTMTMYLLPLLLIFSVFLLFRGHNHPGGGFVGGLVASAAYSLYLLGFGIDKVKTIFRLQPIKVLAFGLFLAASSTVFPILFGKPLMTGVWYEHKLPIVGSLGTPTVFDTGVYFTVLGVTLNIIFTLFEDKE